MDRGNNSYAQLGNGTYDPVTTPSQVGGEGIGAISAGGYHTGIKSYGTSFAWGRNTSGQLGDGKHNRENCSCINNKSTSNDKVPITVKPLPDLAIKASPSAVVSGTAISLNAIGASSYLSGGIMNGVAFTPSASDSYTVTGTGANGCMTTLAQPVTVRSRKAAA
jgi:hypothetical protein